MMAHLRRFYEGSSSPTDAELRERFLQNPALAGPIVEEGVEESVGDSHEDYEADDEDFQMGQQDYWQDHP